jgi:hypothetical protein
LTRVLAPQAAYPLPDIGCHLVADLHAHHELVWV